MSTPPADPYGAQGEPFREPGPHPAGGAPAAGYGAGHRGPMKNGLGIAALVVGVLSLPAAFTIIGGVVLGLLAIVLGLVGRGRAKRGEADNGGMALAGVVLGALGVVLSVVLVAAGVALFNSQGGQDLVDCLAEAGNDQAAVEQCQRQFEEGFGQ
ncbi:MAG TPA: DUF4190 domain-containing protein [Mycobacteriales bacterium]|nr:DUF4190 domain-containing protein [Mycobacteriales bacterium]